MVTGGTGANGLMNGRTVKPLSLQKQMLLILHEGHQGIDKTRYHARDSIYWPGIDREIEAAVKNVRTLLKKCGSVNHDEFWKGMLAIRNTPLSCGKSQAQLLFGQPLDDFPPHFPHLNE